MRSDSVESVEPFHLGASSVSTPLQKILEAGRDRIVDLKSGASRTSSSLSSSVSASSAFIATDLGYLSASRAPLEVTTEVSVANATRSFDLAALPTRTGDREVSGDRNRSDAASASDGSDAAVTTGTSELLMLRSGVNGTSCHTSPAMTFQTTSPEDCPDSLTELGAVMSDGRLSTGLAAPLAGELKAAHLTAGKPTDCNMPEGSLELMMLNKRARHGQEP